MKTKILIVCVAYLAFLCVSCLSSEREVRTSSTDTGKASQTQSSSLQVRQGTAVKGRTSAPQTAQPRKPEIPINLAMGKASKTEEGKVTIPIDLSAGGQKISALSNDLSYDPKILANPKATVGEAGSKAQKKVISNEIRPGMFRVGVIGFNQTVIPDGVVAYVTFDVLKDGPISVNNHATASTPDGKAVSVIVK